MANGGYYNSLSERWVRRVTADKANGTSAVVSARLFPSGSPAKSGSATFCIGQSASSLAKKSSALAVSAAFGQSAVSSGVAAGGAPSKSGSGSISAGEYAASVIKRGALATQSGKSGTGLSISAKKGGKSSAVSSCAKSASAAIRKNASSSASSSMSMFLASSGVAGIVIPLASLGAASLYKVERKENPSADVQAQVQEAIPDDVVSRLREEMLAATMTAELIQRAKARRRADEEALLLML